ncbi:Predicted hydrolase or acyltransferase [Candidatus Terasakiella magnetica]|nr:Predicted hydrolase or acyltransferase [Candidatus Terasakiella magnetica]
MTPTLLLVHGWGFNGGFWSDLLDHLPDFPAEVVDLGFYGAPIIPTVKRPLVIAHSMGLAWALANIPRPWAGVLAVNAFPRFTRAPHFVEGVPPRLVERMLARFAEEPAEVTAEFLRRCGIETPPPAAALNPERLGEALAWLGKCDERTALKMLNCPVQAIAATKDTIVPEAMSRAAFAGLDLVLAEGGGHLLPLTHPDWLAAQIRQFAARAS